MRDGVVWRQTCLIAVTSLHLQRIEAAGMLRGKNQVVPMDGPSDLPGGPRDKAPWLVTGPFAPSHPMDSYDDLFPEAPEDAGSAAPPANDFTWDTKGVDSIEEFLIGPSTTKAKGASASWFRTKEGDAAKQRLDQVGEGAYKYFSD
eukprot:gnl/MRDRNA2_/MRDRNA2_105085_c0_seq1.p1 gnl/MRDRNA2_/MRDRNA2_105085_c0~~gnl/MRDRNA2_/MRDRNA2_105085_c0_seq1.p1  ORF type:complete len:146 (+),score=25.19 gnl/MRDRNA2_/MRDRNA2_105085_c0_seq1:94-531(+)